MHNLATTQDQGSRSPWQIDVVDVLILAAVLVVMALGLVALRMGATVLPLPTGLVKEGQ